MRLAVSTFGGEVAAHFGRCSEYTIVNIQDGTVVNRETVENPGHSPGYLPRYLEGKDVDVVMAGGMGSRAQGLFDECGITTIVGVTGSVDEAIEAFILDDLDVRDSLCDHLR